MTSVLLYYMAFVFMGKGIRELQEGGVHDHHRVARMAARRGDRNLPERGDAAGAGVAARAVRVRPAQDVLAVTFGHVADDADRRCR